MNMKEMRAVLRLLENTPSTLEKQEILIDALQNPVFKSMIQYALDPYLTYGIIQIPVFLQGHGPAVTWKDVEIVLTQAHTKVLTGTALKVRIAAVLSGMTPSGIELFRRILLKDLRCGVGATLVNKVSPGLIPQFGVMLASPLEAQHITKIKATRAWYQAKKNGDRMVAMLPPRSVGMSNSSALSRKGHPLHNYQGILRSLEFVLDQSPYFREGMVFDGEVIVGDFFKTRETKKLKDNETKGAVFHCFDMVPLSQWISNKTYKYGVRRNQLSIISNSPAWQHFDNLQHVPSFPIDPVSFSMKEADRLRDDQIANGEEGLIIRLDSPYNFTTRSSIFKHKKMDNMDCMILEVLEGENDFEGTAGSMMIELEDGETRQKAGIQATRPERDKIWAARNEYAGQMCEVAYQDMTRPKNGPPRLQFPVFKKLRKDLS